MDRISWDDYFFGIMDLVSQRSTCTSRMVGAVLVDEKTHNVISVGYNGAPRGLPHCDHTNKRSGKDWDICRAVHGEVNAILNAAKNGASTDGASLYLPVTPCTQCARIIINAGIRKIYYKAVYTDSQGIEELKMAGIECVLK